MRGLHRLRGGMARVALSAGVSLLGSAALAAAFVAGTSRAAPASGSPPPLPRPSPTPTPPTEAAFVSPPEVVTVIRTVPAQTVTIEGSVQTLPGATVTEQVTATETVVQTVSVPVSPVTRTETVTKTVTVPGWP